MDRQKTYKVVTMLSDGSTTEDVREVPLKDENGDTIAVFLGLPLTYVEYKRRLRSPRYTKKVPASNGRPESEKTDSESCVRDFLIERVTGWRQLVASDDKPIPFTEENKRALFTEHFDYLTQVRIAGGLTGAEVSEFTEGDKSEPR